MVTNDANTDAVAVVFNAQVQVPARIDHYQGLNVPATGLAIEFIPDGSGTFAAYNGGPNGQALPYVNVSWPGGIGITYYQFTNFTTAGLTITFYNALGVAVVAPNVNIATEGY